MQRLVSGARPTFSGMRSAKIVESYRSSSLWYVMWSTTIVAFSARMQRETLAMNSSGLSRNMRNLTGAMPLRIAAALLRVMRAAVATSPSRSYVTPEASSPTS